MLADEAAVLAALRQHWMDEWVDPHNTPYIWDDDDDKPAGDAYLQIGLHPASNNDSSMGRTRFENRGLIIVAVRHIKDGGPGAVERLASEVAAIWKTRLPWIVLGLPQPIKVNPEGGFNRYNVQVEWRADLRSTA